MFELSDLLREQTRVKPKANAVLDSCGGKKESSVLDDVSDNSSITYLTNTKARAIAAIQEWTECDDSLEAGETCADRLLAMVIGIANKNLDSEITEKEQYDIDIALNAIWDYLSSYGVDDADIDALLNDWDNDAAERVKDLLAASLPEGEGADTDITNFVDDVDQGAVFDAAYKKTVVVRNGKKTRINKRISGAVRLTPAQKVAVEKMLMKSHSAIGNKHRAKSMKVRSKMGL